MKVDEELIKHVADVARLKLSYDEDGKFVPQLKEILEYFEVLGKVQVETEPSFQPVEMKNRLREDKITKSLSQDDALKLSKNKDGYFLGPKAV